MDYHSRMGGAQYLAYPPVVAGGARANTIHYITNNQLVEDGDMVLMDAGTIKIHNRRKFFSAVIMSSRISIKKIWVSSTRGNCFYLD